MRGRNRKSVGSARPDSTSGALEVGRQEHCTAHGDGLGVGVAAFADQSESDEIQYTGQSVNVKADGRRR